MLQSPRSITLSLVVLGLLVAQSSIAEESPVTSPYVGANLEMEEGLTINPGMNGAWYDPNTAGQGVLFDISASLNVFFAAWFTYETDQGITLSADENAHRWLIAQGSFEGVSASLTLYLADGGVFDHPTEVTTTPAGTATIQFTSCTEATFDYVLDAGLAGSIALSRLTPDVLCGDLIGQTP